RRTARRCVAMAGPVARTVACHGAEVSTTGHSHRPRWQPRGGDWSVCRLRRPRLVAYRAATTGGDRRLGRTLAPRRPLVGPPDCAPPYTFPDRDYRWRWSADGVRERPLVYRGPL